MHVLLEHPASDWQAGLLVGTTFRPCLVVASRTAVVAPVAVWKVETQNGEHQPSGEIMILIIIASLEQEVGGLQVEAKKA